jgi:glycosyltransferase involved in cell wall biosynthesis
MRPPVLFLEQQSWRAGGQRVLEDVLDALREDVEPLVAFPEDGPFAAALRNRNIETLLYPLGTYRPGRKSIGEMLEFAGRSLVCGLHLAPLIARRGIRLIYINGPRCLPAGVLAGRLTRTPSIFHLHRVLTRKTDLLIAARAATHVTRIVAVSLVGANPRLAGTTQVLYNPVHKPIAPNGLVSADSDPPTQIAPGAGPVVGMVGRITPQKGQRVLLRAAALLVERWPNLQVVIVGAPERDNSSDAAYLRELEYEVMRLGLANHIHWAGFQDNLDLYYRRFDMVAIPSIEAEGFSLVALEAARWGVPAVASRGGGVGEVVRDGVSGLLVVPGNEEALAQALDRVLGDPVLRARLVAGTRTTLDQRFSLETFRRTIGGIVSGLVAPKHGVAREKEIEARA